MPIELLTSLISHGGLGIALAIVFLLLSERKERLAMAKLLLESSKDQIISTSANTTATANLAVTFERVVQKIDQLIQMRGGK